MASKLTGSAAELPGGSRSTPSLNFNQASSDANTGLYRPAADAIEFVTGGDAAILLDADGNVGIGMTYGVSPSVSSVDYRLDVSGDVNFRKFVRVSGYAGSPNQVLTATGYGATWANLDTVYNFLTIGINTTALDNATTGIGSGYGGNLVLNYYTSTDSNTVDVSDRDIYSQFTTTKTASIAIDSEGFLSLTV